VNWIRKINMSGTSVATALATHGALRILDALQELPHDPPYREVDPAFYAVILKALLIHSAQWDENTATVLKTLINENGRFAVCSGPRFREEPGFQSNASLLPPGRRCEIGFCRRQHDLLSATAFRCRDTEVRLKSLLSCRLLSRARPAAYRFAV
jgi:hypothetical protein